MLTYWIVLFIVKISKNALFGIPYLRPLQFLGLKYISTTKHVVLGGTVYQHVSQSMIEIQVPTKFSILLSAHTVSPFESTPYIFRCLDSSQDLIIPIPVIFRSTKILFTAIVMVSKVLSWKRKYTKIFNLRQNSLSHTVSSFEYRIQTLYLSTSWFFLRSSFRHFLDHRKNPITAKVIAF